MTDGYLKTCGDFSARHWILLLTKTYKNYLLYLGVYYIAYSMPTINGLGLLGA